MRELLRAYAKAEMQRQGYTKVNRIMSGCWREFLKTFTPPAQSGVFRPRPRRRRAIRPKSR